MRALPRIDEAGFDSSTGVPTSVAPQPQAKLQAPEEPPADGGGGGGLGDLPEIPPPPPPNTPLAVEGSFARPGTAEALPFATDALLRDRLITQGEPRELRFGAGSASAGGGLPDEDLLAAIRASRRRGGGM